MRYSRLSAGTTRSLIARPLDGLQVWLHDQYRIVTTKLFSKHFIGDSSLMIFYVNVIFMYYSKKLVTIFTYFFVISICEVYVAVCWRRRFSYKICWNEFYISITKKLLWTLQSQPKSSLNRKWNKCSFVSLLFATTWLQLNVYHWYFSWCANVTCKDNTNYSPYFGGHWPELQFWLKNS